jgi:Zn-dependent protease with chaperone function
VRVRLLTDQLHLYQGNEETFIQRFPFSGMACNQVGNTHYLYLDQKGLQYLQFPATHPLAQSIQKQVAGANPYWGQKLLQQQTAVLLCLLVVLGTGLYLGFINLIPFIGCRMIGVEQEIQMGNRMKEVMLNEAEMLGAKIDTAGTRKLQAFADQLQLSTHYPIKLTLVSSDIVNAYALPGGQIVVYSGILEKINSPEALTALLGHESSHVNERHSLRSLLRNAANGIIVAVVFNDATGISGALVSNVNTLNGLRYSPLPGSGGR